MAKIIVASSKFEVLAVLKMELWWPRRIKTGKSSMLHWRNKPGLLLNTLAKLVLVTFYSTAFLGFGFKTRAGSGNRSESLIAATLRIASLRHRR